MTIDLAPLLRRLVLAGLAGFPLAATGCGSLCDIQPDQVFLWKVAVFDDRYTVLQPGVARPDGAPPPDPVDAGNLEFPTLAPEDRALYDACRGGADDACRAFCDTIARRWFTQGLDLRTCHLSENGSDRPDVVIAGLGTNAVCGRRPDGLQAPCPPAEGSAVGRYLAQAAHLEAASVPAFRRLARELSRHGAPAPLCRAAGRAARDEARHALLVGRLARAAGARPPRVVVAPARPRSLAALAVDNAVEGCVRETFGAAIVWWQAAAAADPAVRAAAAHIAPDETRHATLAWQIDAWATRQLPRSARQELRAARARALDTLTSEWSATLPAAVRHPLGLPDGPAAVRLIGDLGAELFARA